MDNFLIGHFLTPILVGKTIVFAVILNSFLLTQSCSYLRVCKYIFCQFTNQEYVVYVFYMLQYVQADDGQFPSSKYRHQRVISGGKHFTGDTQTSQIHIWPIFHNYGYLGCNLALAILELFIPPPITT